MHDRNLLYPLFDRYWCRLAFPTYRYEPEIGELLRRAPTGSIDLFLDGGANIGMWSKVASGVARDVVAIEASSEILPFLRWNAMLDQARFDVVEKALWSESGLQLSFCCSQHKHAGASIAEVARHDVTRLGWRIEPVTTIAIDDLVTQRGHSEGRGVLVLKIDVEGAEIAVIQGASRVLASGRGLLIYEDHGKDSAHEVTRHLLSRDEFDVYHWGADGLRKIGFSGQLKAIKRVRWLGYNFFCCRRGGAAERLLGELFGKSA